MSSTKEQVTEFLDKCEELKKCKFIMATTKIKDLLRIIVKSPELYGLFDTVTKKFNYPEQKALCLVRSDDGLDRSRVELPKTVGQRLAFIFCLLVEFDKDTMNFNDFLQTYYREDGSYFSSYQAFCNEIISSLEDMLKQVFKEQLDAEEHSKAQPSNKAKYSRANGLSAILLDIEAEKQYLLQIPLNKDERENGIKILNALAVAVKCGDIDFTDALICGYNYFILTNRCVSDGIAPLIENIAEYEAAL